MKLEEFLPVFKLRSPNIMVLMGAGTSVAAGIPTAWDMIWDFKSTLFCVENKKPLSYCQDLSNPVTKTIIQNYFDRRGNFPLLGSESEYAYYFETLYSNEGDRRRYIDLLVSKGKPSYGHLVLASLVRLDKIRILWTTNFDRIIEDAIIPLFGSSGKLVTANLDNAKVAIQALNEARWPLLVKLHGDFQSTKLKNTTEELKKQDTALLECLIEASRRYGLAVMGYSGRDKSIIEALNKVVENGKGFPAGLFWFYRAENPPFDSVKNLIKKAVENGFDAHMIEMETFDELIGDLLLLEDNLPDELTKYINLSPKRISEAPIKSSSGKYPIIRLNALRIISWPNTCRRLNCNIGGLIEVRDAVKQSGAKVIAARRKEGVLLFGSDTEAKKAFSKFGIKDFDVHDILVKRMKYDSQELGLLYEALTLALSRNLHLRIERKRNIYFLVIPADKKDDNVYNVLKAAAQGLSGVVSGTSIAWSEAIEIKLEYKLDRLWLLIIPTIWQDRSKAARKEEIDIADEFVRSRYATRYNNKYNDIIEAWIGIVVGTVDTKPFSAFGIQDGIDANFVVSRITAFSCKEK